MKKIFSNINNLRLPVILLMMLCNTLSTELSAANPDIAPWMANLSGQLNQEGFDDKMPEIVVSGNTVHVVWLEYKYGTECNLYYCRSTDLGKNWEKPVVMQKIKDTDYGKDPLMRKLAVDGNNVHVCIIDYDYQAGGIGRIFYTRSANGGATFEPVKEIASTGGGFNRIRGCMIKASGGKVAVAYFGTGSKNGLRMLYSANGGTSFVEKLISEEPIAISDFWYDGSQMIVASEYVDYYYGLSEGKVFVSVSNDNAATFTTKKVSVTFIESGTYVRERCRCYHDSHYTPKIAKSGNSIHVVFTGYNENGVWTILYARSADNGATFMKTTDINNGVLSNIVSGQEAIASLNGNVYVAYLSTGGKVFFTSSSDNGATFSTAKNIMAEGFAYIESTWWPSLVTDPTDNTGKTVYVTGQSLFSMKSTDGGKTLFNATLGTPVFSVSWIMADMAIDSKGQRHWICEAKWKGGTETDLFYRGLVAEPAPGSVDKALKIQTNFNPAVFDLTIVPSSPSLQFDSAMTAEAWVKLIPVTDNGSVNILAKLNGYDGYDWTPNGFNLGFRYGSGVFAINSGIKTDKGDFVNWAPGTIKDTLWHHIAFTYDAGAGLNNYITYIDGLPLVKQTVTGLIIKGDGLLMIGSRSDFYKNTRYYVDNIRLWNKALSQDELLGNQQRKSFTGDRNLKLNLTFDDTFKDISGNGNDAIPLNLGEKTPSNFNPPIASFEIFKTGSEISFNNRTVNGSSFAWNFGNGITSELGNPKITYSSPGEYLTSLTAKNSNSVTSALKNVSIEGLNRVEPNRAGVNGYVTVSVYGGGISLATQVSLAKQGEPNINAVNFFYSDKGLIVATFDLGGAKTGVWDLLVAVPNKNLILPASFTIDPEVIADPWMTFSGRGLALVNTWHTYTIEYGNDGNTDMFAVPLWLAVSDIEGLEVEFIDFKVVLPDTAYQLGIANQMLHIPEFIKTDRVMGTDFKARAYPLMVPVIPANSRHTLHIRIKSPEKFKIKTWMSPPQMRYLKTGTKSAAKWERFPNLDLWLSVGYCVGSSFFENLVDVAMINSSKISCIYQGLKAGYKHLQIEKDADQKEKMWNQIYNHSSSIITCGMAIAGTQLSTMISIGMNLFDFARGAAECSQMFRGIAGYEFLVNTVLSFDPNEMIGPAGYGDKKYIQKNKYIPYTVLFENKSTASAPAHIVTVTDTLDLTKFDVAGFGFSSFGFGDTIVSIQGNNRKEFSLDIDLRPRQPLITRVSGKLDTITGIVRWEFLSLNPLTLKIEEDPMTGFLPPNNANHAGEGFVGFSVGLKKELGTNIEIKNKASIVFDANKPIVTNEYVNTLDLDKPQSSVMPLEATTDSRFPVTWSGSDVGSGIAHYTVYVMENDTSLYAWKMNTTLTSDEFAGNVGSNYKFYSIATDNVNLWENSTGEYDAQTTVVVHSKEFELVKEELILFPNPAQGSVNLQLRNAPCGMYAVELIGLNGHTYHSELYRDYNLQQGITLSIKDCIPGNYIVRVVYGNRNVVRKIVVR